MSKRELFFYGKDFSPIVNKVKNEKEYCFGFFTKIDGEIFTPNGEKKGPKGDLAALYADKEKQFNILASFLETAQSNIDKIILDSSLREEDKILFDYHNQTMYFGGLVGVVSIKDFNYEGKLYDITLQINTRMDFSNEDYSPLYKKEKEGKSFKPFFLMTLLFDGFTPLNNSKVNRDSETLTDMLLLYSFVERYKIAYVKGYYKTYHTIQQNDSRVKGAVDIARHIRMNSGLNNGKIAYSYKEKGEFNFINLLIIAAYEQLKKKYRKETELAFRSSIDIRNSLESLKYLTSAHHYSKKMIISKTSFPMSHPFYTEYEDLRKTCIKILREEKISLLNGDKDDQVEGALMYVPDLWEKYIEKYFRNLTFKAQEQIKIMNVNSGKEYQQNTRPDFVFYNNKFIPYMILDAKFKPGWLDVARSGKIGNILLPDYDKCIRDMVSISANATGVIFPVDKKIQYNDKFFIEDDKSFEYVHSISKYNLKQKFYTFPVYVPNIQGDFISWKKEFIDNCKRSFFIISEIINKYNSDNS